MLTRHEFFKFPQIFGFSTGNKPEKNDSAFNRCSENLKEGEVLFIPPGWFNVNQIHFNPPDFCGLICFGRLIFDEVLGSGLTIGDHNKRRQGYQIQGLRLASINKYYVESGIGLELVNVNSSEIQISELTGFDIGLRSTGANKLGCCHNKVRLGQLIRNRIGIDIHRQDDGWSNESIYEGGNFNINKAKWAKEYRFINISSKNTQTNYFIKPSLQGNVADDSRVIGIYCNGHNNYWSKPRFEVQAKHKTRVFWDWFSKGNEIRGGYGFKGLWRKHGEVVNRGIDNKIYGDNIDSVYWAMIGLMRLPYYLLRKMLG